MSAPIDDLSCPFIFKPMPVSIFYLLPVYELKIEINPFAVFTDIENSWASYSRSQKSRFWYHTLNFLLEQQFPCLRINLLAPSDKKGLSPVNWEDYMWCGHWRSIGLSEGLYRSHRISFVKVNELCYFLVNFDLSELSTDVCPAKLKAFEAAHALS